MSWPQARQAKRRKRLHSKSQEEGLPESRLQVGSFPLLLCSAACRENVFSDKRLVLCSEPSEQLHSVRLWLFILVLPQGAFSRCRYSLEPLTVTPTLSSVVLVAHLEALQKQARIPIPAVHQVQGAKIFKMMFKSFLLTQVVYPRSLLSNKKYWDRGAMCWRLNTFFRLTPPCVAVQHTMCVLFWEHRMFRNCSLTVPSTGLLLN